MSKVRFLTGRLNVSGAYETNNFEEKFQFIMDRLLAGNSITNGKFRYRFMGVNRFISNDIDLKKTDHIYIVGLLVKYKPDGGVRQFDETTGVPVEYPVPNQYTAASDFLLEIKHGLIAYHPIPNRITTKQFKESFCDILEEAVDDLPMIATINTLPPRVNVLKELRSFDVVDRVQTTLYPSNPNFGWLWAPVDERLKAAKATRYTEIFSVSGDLGESSLDIGDESPVIASVAMAADGYGTATVAGLRDGEYVEYRTESDTREVQASHLIELPEKPSSEELESVGPQGFKVMLDHSAIVDLVTSLDEHFAIVQDQNDDD